MKRYFVTGTDTGVGKTYVTAALARRARERDPNARVFAFKPIETGCEGRFGDDQELLARAAGNWQQGELRGLYQFRQPAAPLVAANAEGRAIDLEEVRRWYEMGRAECAVSLVEGAGGWRVPITSDTDMATLARQLDIPVIVVARAGLGTINHSLLTLEAVERDGCAAAALVLSRRPDDDLDFARSNADQIARRWPGTVILLDTDTSVLDLPLLS